jgi:hypothetical protein
VLDTFPQIGLIIIYNMEDFENNEKYATYKHFAVGDEKSVYKLTIGGYQGDAGED